jgi:hypothetical protein
VHEGWLREADHQSLSLPPLRPRRGRSLLERLPAPFRMRHSARQEEDEAIEEPARRRRYDTAFEPGTEPSPYDFLEPSEAAATAPAPAARAAEPQRPGSPGAGEIAEIREPPSPLEVALATFNTSEYPRRVAGVARSLGAPEVNVRPAEHAASVVRILVAWELCWYRYEVDLDEPEAGARVAAQGTELAELGREDRLVNAVADDSGAVSLSGG